MQNYIKEDEGLSHLDFKFTIIDLSSHNPDVFLKSNVPEAFILALLCRAEEEGKTDAETFCELMDLERIFEEEVREMGLEIDIRKSFI